MPNENRTDVKQVELKEPKVIHFPPGVHDGEETPPEAEPKPRTDGPSMNVEDWSPQELNQFISETYRFVNQLHLEHVTLTSILLERGVVTTQELDKMFHQIRMRHDQAMNERIRAEQMARMGIAEDGAPEGEPVALELDLGSKPIVGRKPPQGHNSGD